LRSLARFFGVLSLVLIFSGSIGGLSPVQGSLLFDRSLPTSNLNNAAGNNRSNVNWADGYYTTNNPTSYAVPGDNFIIGSPGSTYHLDTITVWTVDDNPSSYTLLGGLPGAISQVSISSAFNQVTYSDGTNYQGTSGTYYPIYQVDFTVDWTINGGTIYQFFIDAPLHNYGTKEDPLLYATPFLHASNAALSGSPQEGADNLFLWLTLNSGTPSSVTSWDSFPNYWDKSSDANVQIYGTPLPGTLLLLGSGLAGLSLWRGRKRFKA
jgi:hypothetical protein